MRGSSVGAARLARVAQLRSMLPHGRPGQFARGSATRAEENRQELARADSLASSHASSPASQSEAELRKLLKSLLRAVSLRVSHEGMRRKSPDVLATRLAELQKEYQTLDAAAKSRALAFLALHSGVDHRDIRATIQKYLSVLPTHGTELLGCAPDTKPPQSRDSSDASPSTPHAETPGSVSGTDGSRTVEASVAQLWLERRLRSQLTPLPARLFDAVNSQPGGMKFLVDLRADLQHFIRSAPASTPTLAALHEMDLTLRERFLAWLSPATLQLRQITWEDSAALLEKIVNYEAVHPMRSLEDLRRRLGAGRRCFAFFHPALPGEPLVFIEAALTAHISTSIDALLNSDDELIPEEQATTAVFYSISNTQAGLKGVDLGNFLIKNVVKLLRRDLPHVRTFVTLSPIPGFSAWLLPRLQGLSSAGLETHGSAAPAQHADQLLLPHELDSVLQHCSAIAPGTSVAQVLLTVLRAPKPPPLALKGPLLRLCARYILEERKRGRALDPVANFHLHNGAIAYQLNWAANSREEAISSSFGIMVNYLYDLRRIEENSNAYETGTIAASDDMRALLGQQSSRL